MTSSNGNIFRVTGPLCGEFTGPGEFPTKRPVTRSFDVFFDRRLNKRLSKQPRGWWLETLSCSLWRQSNEVLGMWLYIYAMTSKINGDCLLVNSENKEKIKAPHYSPFVKGIHQMNGTFFSQRAFYGLTFPFHHSPKGKNFRKKSIAFYLNTRRAALYGYL